MNLRSHKSKPKIKLCSLQHAMNINRGLLTEVTCNKTVKLIVTTSTTTTTAAKLSERCQRQNPLVHDWHNPVNKKKFHMKMSKSECSCAAS